MIVIMKAHLHISTYKLCQMSVCVRILGSEHCKTEIMEWVVK